MRAKFDRILYQSYKTNRRLALSGHTIYEVVTRKNLTNQKASTATSGSKIEQLMIFVLWPCFAVAFNRRGRNSGFLFSPQMCCLVYSEGMLII